MLVRGVNLGVHTECAHHHSPRDIVAVRFRCCDAFYACIHCHEELAGHEPVVWLKSERETRAILCGKCHNVLSIAEYIDCGSVCPFCRAEFNPNCERHYRFYFEIE